MNVPRTRGRPRCPWPSPGTGPAAPNEARFDEDLAEELRARAKDALLAQAISSEQAANEAAADLLAMDGMDEELAKQLAAKGIVTMEDLAEQAVEELLDIEGMDSQRAGELIMAARAPWFEGEE